MRPDAGDVSSPHYKPWSKIKTPSVNLSRVDWDLTQNSEGHAKHAAYWQEKNYTSIPRSLFEVNSNIWLEVGAGTGAFFLELARKKPDTFFVAIERCKLRGRRLVAKTEKSGLKNIKGFKGNAIPALITGVPDSSIERLYILYPCPWPKNSQRKHRWYLHAVMPHLVRILKPGGLLIWASDQEFYIREASFVCEQKFKLETLVHGLVAPNPYNNLEEFPEGRTKFERSFLSQGLPCYELISKKTEQS